MCSTYQIHCVANLAAGVVVARQLLDDEEALEVALLVGDVEQRRRRLDIARDAGDTERVPLLNCWLAWTRRARRTPWRRPRRRRSR
jgi:phage tail sheath gpL-like